MRTPVTLKIKFKSASLDQFIERYSVDVSRGGIFIRTKEPLAIGTQLKFEFQLQDASSLIAGEGTVVWIREHDPARTGVAPGMGVRFDRLQPASQGVLTKILTEKQKRGDAAQESRFDAGVRASASASGTVGSASPTPVSTPVVTADAIAASARLSGHNDFSGGDSKHETPLPAPAPGLDDPAEEFAEESTRVMQDAVVQALASRTREETAKPKPPIDDGFSDEVTRHSGPDPEALRQSASPGATSSSTSLPASKPTPPIAPPPVATNGSSGGSNGAGSSSVKPGPTHASGPTMGGPLAGAISPASERASTPPQKSSSAAPIIIVVAILLLGAGGAYYLFGRTPPAPTPDPTVTQPVTPPTTAQANPANPNPAANPAVNPTAPDTTAKPAVPDTAPVAKLERWVDISSTPAGAEIVVDGKSVGKTPYKLHLTDDKADHALEIKRAGFVAQTRTITSSDPFLSQGTKEVLTLAVPLEAEAKAVKAPPAPTHHAAAHKSDSHKASLPQAPPLMPVDKPAPEGDKPVEVKPEGDKPAGDAPKDDTAKPETKAETKAEKAADAKAEKAAEVKAEKAAEKAADTKEKPADDSPPADKTP